MGQSSRPQVSRVETNLLRQTIFGRSHSLHVSAMICTGRIRRGSHSGPQHLRQGFAPALAASCCFILIGAASNNPGLTVTAGIVMIPAALGIAKAVVFLREKEVGLLGIS